VEWLKVKALSSNPVPQKGERERERKRKLDSSTTV
jgi:hypothetical protein